MSAELHKTLVRRTFDEVMSKGNLSILDEVIGEDYVNHDAPPQVAHGTAGMRAMVTMLRTAFPDLHIQIEELIADDEKVVARTIMTGTHRGPFFGIPATGRSVRQDQVHIIRFASGKGVEHRAVRDDLALMQQLGVVPTPEHARA